MTLDIEIEDQKPTKFKLFRERNKAIFAISKKLLPKSFLQIIFLMVIFSLIAAGIWLILADITHLSWNYTQFMDYYWDLERKYNQIVNANPEFVINDEVREILSKGNLYQQIFRIIRMVPFLFIFLGVYIFSSNALNQIHSFINSNTTEPIKFNSMKIWIKSVKQYFTSWRYLLFSITLWVLLVIILPFSFIIFIYPGIVILVSRLFSIDALFESERPVHAIKASKYYSEQRFLQLSFFIFIFLLLPVILGSWLKTPILSSIFSVNTYFDFVDPNQSQYLMAFFYHFLYYFFISLPTLLFPIIYHSAFIDAKQEMKPFNYEYYTKSGIATFEHVKSGSEKYAVEIDITQKTYQCLKCEHDIPIAIKFCPECGIRYTIQYKN